MNYERLLSYGHVFQLRVNCDTKNLLSEINSFPMKQYNPDKDINRLGLSVTTLDGEMNGIDLDTLRDKEYDELDFRTLTKVYHASKEVQKLVNPFLPWLGRSHFLNIRKGGYFPPHRDEISKEQNSFRLIVPISKFNPPHNYMIFNDEVLRLNEGYVYFLNTNIVHSDFSFSDETLMLIMNVEFCEESCYALLSNLHDI